MKAAQNKDFVFRFSAPSPLAATPTLAYTLPDGSTSGPSAMTPAHADVTVTALGADRRTLTLSASASAASLVGVGPGRAWLITVEDGYLGVTIVRVDGTTAILGDVLPRSLSLTSSATLSWAGYEYTIPAADTATRGIINTTGSSALGGLAVIDLLQQIEEVAVVTCRVLLAIPSVHRVLIGS